MCKILCTNLSNFFYKTQFTNRTDFTKLPITAWIASDKISSFWFLVTGQSPAPAPEVLLLILSLRRRRIPRDAISLLLHLKLSQAKEWSKYYINLSLKNGGSSSEEIIAFPVTVGAWCPLAAVKNVAASAASSSSGHNSVLFFDDFLLLSPNGFFEGIGSYPK